jgi:alpha-L-rhamnosidase
VKSWDETGNAGEWSEPAWFETALLHPADWQDAAWIGCTRAHDAPTHVPADAVGDWIKGPEGAEVRKFSHEFDLPDKTVVSAILWWGNSKPLAMQVNGLDLMRTRGARTASFVDLAHHLKPGAAMPSTRHKGRIQDLALVAGMHIIYADGTEQRIRSGADWKVTVAGQPRRPVAATIAGSYGSAPYGKAVFQPQTDLPPVWLRTGFKVGDSLSRARLYLCALGSGIPHINGERIDDAFFSPPQSDYEDFSYYTTHDITARLKPGDNTLAILLDCGWFHQVGGFGTIFSYGHPGLRAVVALDYADGRTEWVTSNRDWQWKEGAIRSGNIYCGEICDYRLDHEEWKNTPPQARVGNRCR